jgi:protein TonB
VSENRFLQSFSALLASAILVCGTHLLLIASSDYGRPQGEQQPAPVATPAPSAAPSAVRESTDVEVAGATPDRSHSDATLFAGDQTPVSPAPADAASSKPSPEMANEPVEKAEADAPPSEATPSPEIKEKPIASAPEQVTPVVEPSEAPKPVEPAATADAEVTTPAEPQMAEAEQAADFTPITPAPIAIEPKAPSTPKLAEADSTPQSAQSVKADPVPPSVPLPAKKPEPPVNAKKLKPAAKQQAATAEAEEQQAATESKPRWAPMALAPADKDTVGKPKVAPKRADAGSYNGRIWSALARHKPRTGKSGSATVTFSIGPAGGVRSVKVSGSSGDSQLDQMALQTVRNAAPFPPPPDPASASYTIRIYFR